MKKSTKNTNEVYKYDFTVFTPLYNRKDTLPRVWDSLNSQTYKNFEWVIVDDFSNDGVEELLSKYEKEATFPVSIIRHEKNLGKHNAWNSATKVAQGRFFIPADSDDAFVPQTLEKFLEFWNTIPETDQTKYSGVNVLCLDPDSKEIVGSKFPGNFFTSDNLELAYKYKGKGEKWGMIRTDLMKKYRFPDTKTNTGYLPEGYLWFHIAQDGYKVLCVNEPLRYYYRDAPNSLMSTVGKTRKRNSESQYIFFSWHIGANLGYILKSSEFKAVFKLYYNLYRNGTLSGRSIGKIYKELSSGLARFYYIFSLPLVLLVYLVRK